jgi:antitoxin Phd
MNKTRTGRAEGQVWCLQDAKARFSEVVRLARRDAVVVVSSEEYDRLCHPETGAALVRAMADARVRDLDMEHHKITPSVRDATL